uniref:Uncharacterized protein n=1 Tax=Iconisemion striatum TaxID=60296 RepID=A0A1A7XWL7_9TELE
MSVLLEKITKIDEPAAKKIEEAGFRSDSEIRDLTREDLRELLPGPKNMKIRINIFKTISKTDSLSELLKKLQGFIPHDLKATLSKTGLLADYLHILKDMKTKQNNVQMFLEAFIKHLESRCGAPSGQEPASASASNAVTNLSEKNTNDPSAETPQDSAMEIDSDKCTGSSHLKRKHQGEEMSILLNKIKKIDQEAADGLEEADLRSDSEIKTLTEQDLHDLCPGLKKFKMRKSILETINKTDLVTEVLNVLWASSPHDDLKATLPDNGVLVDFLNILKDMKTQQNDVQMFLEDQIKRLESSCDAPSGQEPASASTSKAVVNQSGKSTKVLSKQTSQGRSDFMHHCYSFKVITHLHWAVLIRPN